MKKRILATALCLVMALSLFVPALGATPLGEETVRAETAASEAGHAHTHAVVERPAVSEDTPAALAATSVGQDHNFTTDGKTSSFYTITGNLSTGKGTVNYNGLTLTQCLKMESATNITFNAPAAGKLTLVFVESAATAKVDGTKLTASNGIITADLAAGAHTIAKADGANLFYISFSGTVAEHTHTYTKYEVTTPATCTEAGEETASCDFQGCAQTNKRTIPAAGHSYKNGTDGICTVCAKDSATGQVHTHNWGEWTKTKDASCSQEGEQKRTCQTAACGAEDIQTIAKIPHTWGANNKCGNCGAEKPSGSFTKVGGHLETAYVQWNLLSGVDFYKVYVKKASESDSAYKPLDNELVRRYPTYMRADALGLAAGSYVIKVECLSGGAVQTSMVTDPITVLAHDRSGFAHMNGHVPGAYKLDGTLKSGAKVLYVTNDNKNTVEWNGAKGIQNILDTLKKNGTPVCVRFIGNITDPSTLTKGDLVIKEVTCGVTFEGVGNDAVINGFGITPKVCTDVEVRNLGFMNCNSEEGDSLSFDGSSSGTYLWSHNNDIFYGDAGTDADQAKGDGSLDTKNSMYVTHSYNRFWDSGKSNLVGMHEGATKLNWITFHHNWYDHSDSRHPRVRGASVHVYNNYFDGLAKYGAGATEASSLFVENNYYRNVTKPLLTAGQGTDMKSGGKGTFSGEDGGMIKAYGNAYVMENRTLTYVPYDANSSTASVDFDAYEAKTRNEKVPTSVKAKKGGATYNNFDTDSSKMYTYTPNAAEDVPIQVTTWAGRVEHGDFQWDFGTGKAVDENYGVDTALKAALTSYKGTLVSVGGAVDGGGSSTPTTCTHDWRWTITKAATCAEAGVKTATCFLCGATNPQTQSIPATGKHSYVNGVCSGCGAVQGTVVDPGPGPGDETVKTYILKGDDVFSNLTPNGKDTGSTPRDLYNCAAYEVLANQGTEGFFTIYAGAVGSSSGTKIDYSSKTIEGESFTYRINFNGAVKAKDETHDNVPADAIGFTTKGAAKVRVWWVQAGGDTQKTDDPRREIAILDSEGTQVAVTTKGANAAKNAVVAVETLTLDKAGTYYLGGSPKKNNIFQVEVVVTETSTEEPEPEEPIEPDVEFRGVLEGLGGERDLYYSYWEDENLVINEMEAGDTVWAATYDADGRFTGVKFLTPAVGATSASVEIPSTTPKLKIFWLGDQENPLSQAKTIWGDEE